MALDIQVSGTLLDGSPKEGWSRVRILGRRLRKFSNWHVFILRAIDSPFLRQGAVTFWDLRTAVAVCSLEYPNSDIRRPWLVPALLRIGLFFRCLFTKSKKLQDGEDNPVQAQLRKYTERFLTYVGDYLQNPEFTVIQTESKGDRAPEVRGLAIDELERLADLIAFTGWDDKKIWNLPLGYSNWLRAFAKRAQGVDISFTTEKEKKWREKLPPEFRHKP